MSTFKVAIIGAGPAGCLLARLLHIKQIEVTVFEAEASPNARSQGGTLDLHPKTGIAALRTAGLYEEFCRLARVDSAGLTITDKQNQPYFQLPAALATNPEIDRVQLRSLLLRSLPGGCVRWNHRLIDIKEAGAGAGTGAGNGSTELVFAHGATEGDFHLVVGADGAWSCVRAVLAPSVKPQYSGIAGYDLSIPNANAREGPRHSWELVKGGNLFAFSDGQSIMGQQMGDGSIQVSVWGRHAEDWATQMRENPPQSPEEVCGEYTGWAPELLDLIRQSRGEMRISALYMLPVDFKWPHRRGMTLMGDAAHLMTPFAGEGVNLALEDAMRLAEAIVAGHQQHQQQQQQQQADALDEQIARYETAMFQRALKAQTLTRKMMQCMYFTERAPRTSIARWVVARAAYDCHPVLEPVIHPFLVAGVYSFYFVFKLFV
ncbi:hypothetical protein ASPZODRAFT_69672 [Penicilliopsis zonata CBS 506.65]|uniref:FAD-binding domain-containing protein n=1 Tax=Penicilliopsis zonata CBS 506.65 TaxID=1073090 RepID=A0A1L9SDM3_9EURO|nr:hypothetical protein ASPZODRAFT_69672 [Penicilliopsis zonata CBS 506.65]OJJ45325.1 hypothetical protein ASPZODRAFT_69672 [Penicilliopsis zonata CBS 506.65]